MAEVVTTVDLVSELECQISTTLNIYRTKVCSEFKASIS